MKISIITVSYNSSRTIKDTFDSIRLQTYKDIEYIVVDGASTDSTLDIINENLDIIDSWVSERDSGLYYAMNKGINMASGDIIGILNSDDMFASPDILSQVAFSFENGQHQVLYGNIDYVLNTDVSRIVRKWRSYQHTKNSFVYGWMPAHPSFFVRSTVYKNYGLFNTSLRLSADYELMLRFLHVYKLNGSYLDLIMVKMRTGGASNASLKSRIRGFKEDIRSWKLNGLKPKVYTIPMKKILKIFQYVT